MRNSDLKGCPFCGGKVKFEYIAGRWGYTTNIVRIACCLARVTAPAEGWEQGRGHYDRTPEARRECGEQWNRRGDS